MKRKKTPVRSLKFSKLPCPLEITRSAPASSSVKAGPAGSIPGDADVSVAGSAYHVGVYGDIVDSRLTLSGRTDWLCVYGEVGGASGKHHLLSWWEGGGDKSSLALVSI